MIGRIAAVTRKGHLEDGFSIMELMVALGVLFVALLALARTATVAFTDVAMARQRQTAAQLTNQLLEQVRGLPYEAVTKGLEDTDVADDPAVQVCDGKYYYPECPPGPEAEKLVHTPGLPNTVPLVPHQRQIGPPEFPQTYSRSVYVTEATGAPQAGAFRVTAVVSWNDPARGGLRDFVEAQTLVYAPEGCVSTSTHPFGAPCLSYFYGNGGAGSGGFETTGLVQDVAFDSIGADLLSQAADAQMEQVTHVDGSASMPLGSRVVSGTETTTTPSAAGSSADNDPSSPGGGYDRQTVGPQGPGVVSVTGGGNELAVSIGGGSTGSTTSTTKAGGANACTTQADGQPCGYATSTGGGSVTETLTLSSDVGTATLVSVGTTDQENTTYMRRYIPSGLGLVRETVRWTLPVIQIGGLPSGLNSQPLGWNGYWVRLSGFTATATAEAGEGTAAPSVSITGGQISAWNGLGYTTTSVTEAGADIVIAPLDHSAGVGTGNTVQTLITGSVRVGRSETSQTVEGTTSTRYDAEAAVGSPLVVNLDYRVIRNATLFADLNLEFDAGTARAATVYQPAPSP